MLKGQGIYTIHLRVLCIITEYRRGKWFRPQKVTLAPVVNKKYKPF
jgi:hypothetical protein